MSVYLCERDKRGRVGKYLRFLLFFQLDDSTRFAIKRNTHYIIFERISTFLHFVHILQCSGFNQSLFFIFIMSRFYCLSIKEICKRNPTLDVTITRRFSLIYEQSKYIRTFFYFNIVKNLLVLCLFAVSSREYSQS